MRTPTAFDLTTSTTFDDLASVADGVIIGLLHEFGEGALADGGEASFNRTWGLWRAVNAALTTAAAGERPADESREVPRWLDGVVAFRLEMLSTTNGRDDGFGAIRLLERRGLVAPVRDDAYVLALVSGLSADGRQACLRSDPDLLTSTFWRIFEVEGAARSA